MLFWELFVNEIQATEYWRGYLSKVESFLVCFVFLMKFWLNMSSKINLKFLPAKTFKLFCISELIVGDKCGTGGIKIIF
jgi:hypothetical protein